MCKLPVTAPYTILMNKVYTPPPARLSLVPRPRLSERLSEALHRRLTLISAPAGFGKSTLVSEWVVRCGRPVAWLSLDEAERDSTRFLTYLLAALQRIAPGLGEGLLAALQSPQPPPPAVILTPLLNEIAAIPSPFVLVLDDYHLASSESVDAALTLLLEHLPPQVHLVITTRAEPDLPLARLRARGQLTELRSADLRFSAAEAATFLNQVMGLALTAAEVTLLESRTEGWIAGLQLAALSMQGVGDAAQFLRSFTGSHRHVLDYLVEEVLRRQPAHLQQFLLHTSILKRLSGPLCDALLPDLAQSGQECLAYLERANLFIIPLDDERRWYRYHHLFADALRQRASSTIGGRSVDLNELHHRASQWYEANGFVLDAFHHATESGNVGRAEQLIERIPLHDRSAVTAVLTWLESLPSRVLHSRPSLLWRDAALRLVNGQTAGVEERLLAAEAALQSEENGELVGRIAAARATLALTRYQVDAMLEHSRRALAYLPPKNLGNRTSAHWTLGLAYFLKGERAAAGSAFAEAIRLGQAAGDRFMTILATIGLGNVQEGENQLYLAAETYRRVLALAGEQPQQIICEAHLGLARLHFEWNELEAAAQYGRQALHLALQYESVIDRFIICELFMARLKLAQGDAKGASALVAQTWQSTLQRNFVHRLPEVAAAQVLALLAQGKRAAAAQLAETHRLPVSQARAALANGDAATAIAILEGWRTQVDSLADQRLKALVLQALTYRAKGERERALQLLDEALTLAEPGGFLRLFIDEGVPMAQLLAEAAAAGPMSAYARKLLALLEAEQQGAPEPLSPREREVLQLIAEGLSNQAISERLFLALDSVKGHNRRIFEKLQVQRRTEAVARARELGLL